MKTLVSILFIGAIWASIQFNWRVNTFIDRAFDAFQKQDYKQTEQSLMTLRDSLYYWELAYEANLGHTQFLSEKYDSAFFAYEQAVKQTNNEQASAGFNQLAISYFFAHNGKEILAKAQLNKEHIAMVDTTLGFLKKALIKNEHNNEARYNYELLSMLQEQVEENEEDQQDQNKDKNQDQQQNEDKKQGQDQQDKQKGGDQNKQDQKEGEQDQNKGDQQKDSKGKDNKSSDKKEKEKGQQGDDEKPSEEKGEEQESDAGKKSKEEEQQERDAQVNQRLQENNMSKEKAEQLLRSMEQQQIKYLQQQKREDSRSDQDNNDRPQW